MEAVVRHCNLDASDEADAAMDDHAGAGHMTLHTGHVLHLYTLLMFTSKRKDSSVNKLPLMNNCNVLLIVLSNAIVIKVIIAVKTN